MIRFVTLCVVALLAVPSLARAQVCAASPVTVQILGSAGPRPDSERASASYLVWIDGQARMLVDVGGGAYLRFAQSGAQLSDLWLLGVSHLHPDHISGLPALLWLSEQTRQEPLPTAGPSGNGIMPAFPTFLSRLFDQNNGAFQILGGTVGDGTRGVPLDVTVVDVASAEALTVVDRPEMTVTAIGIPHGNIPALAYRVQVGDASIVFSTDQNGTSPSFVEFARDADILVMHLAIASGTNSALHAAPAVVGRVAQDAGVGRLILSHIGLFDLESAVAEVKTSYTGPLTVGADLQCTPVE
jgi:ribonuclease BN (tRNA processing enzyme)